jgi:hypothetical protein
LLIVRRCPSLHDGKFVTDDRVRKNRGEWFEYGDTQQSPMKNITMEVLIDVTTSTN